MLRPLSLFAVLACVAAPAAAQEKRATTSPLISALGSCQAIADSAARLACYDKAAGALVAAATGGDLAVVDREQVRNVRRSLFGFALPDFPFFARDDKKDEEAEPKELVSALTSFRSAGNGKFRFTIKDGNALWETTESAPLNDPDVGDPVTIRRGALGSYFAQIGSQRWVRARRVR